MLIGLKQIQHLFSEKNTFLKERSSAPKLTGFYPLADAPVPYNDYTLYLLDNLSSLQYLTPITGMSLLYFASEADDFETITQASSSAINLLIVKVENKNDALLKLHQFFNQEIITGLFSEDALNLLFYENGIQAIVDHAYQLLKNSITVFDTDFRLIAMSSTATPQPQSGLPILENKGFTSEFFDIINKEHIHEKVKKSDLPLRVHLDAFGFDQMVCNIDINKNVGHIVLSETERPFHPNDYYILIQLKKAINQQMRKDAFIRNNKGFLYEYFLRDLLDGKIATKQQFADRLNYTNHAFSGTLYCMVIETARSSQALNTQHIRITLENALPGTTTLMYHGEIIVILDLKNKKRIADESFQILENICKKYGLYAGLSNCFQNIVNLENYYKQGLRAIEIGICVNNAPGIFRYADHYLEHVTNIFAQKENLDTFNHPDFKLLLQYDKENGTNLSYLLYMYLIHERNIVATAAAVDLHRNSLQYRMKKIFSLISMDCDDYHERQYYVLSYTFYHGIGTDSSKNH